jgi:VanZ family protein
VGRGESLGPTDWGPPVLWMGVILWFSSDAWSASHTGALLIPLLRWLLPWASVGQLTTLHAGIRKLAHLGEYAALALLWYRAFARRRDIGAAAAAQWAFAITVGWAGVDEGRQVFTMSRTASLRDVGIDSVGAALALVAARIGRAIRARRRPAG